MWKLSLELVSNLQVNVAIDHISTASPLNHKCVLLEWQMPKIRFMGGGTYTMGAMLEAQVKHL